MLAICEAAGTLGGGGRLRWACLLPGGANPVSSLIGEADGEVPGSAVLVFDIELLELVAGLPEGYMFIWNGEVSPNLFEEIDKDGDGEVLLEEVTDLQKRVGLNELGGALLRQGIHSRCEAFSE